MNTGNTAWILVCSALVLLMTPGLAFFYGGLVREKQVINTIKMSFISLGIIAVLWALVGYSLAFAPGSAFIGSLEWAGLRGVGPDQIGQFAEGVPDLAFMAFQMMFAIITPALISGAVVGRMRFRAYAAFIALWSVLVYSPLAHWVWGPGGWIGELGALDFAGGTVVHVSAGVSALVAAAILGPQRREGSEAPTPHNVPFVVLGASLLWFGWFGFNAGSALAADSVAVLAFVTTMLAPAAAVLAWIGLEILRSGKPSATGAAIAAIVGLVAVTPAAGFVMPLAAMAIGSIAAVISFFTVEMLRKSRLDDTLDVFACHGVGGIVGSILTGVFATVAVNPGGANGLLAGDGSLVVVQTIAVFAAAIYAGGVTALILFGLRLVTNLRTSVNAERIGIDIMEHAERAYHPDTRLAMAVTQHDTQRSQETLGAPALRLAGSMSKYEGIER